CSGASEAKHDAAVDAELVRVLRIADEIASPVRIAPIAHRVALDVGRRPLRADAVADARRREALDAGAPRRRELRLTRRRAGDGAAADGRAREVHAAEVRGAEAAEEVRPDFRVVLAPVVPEVAVIGVDGEIAHFALRGAAEQELRELVAPH